MSAIKRIRVEGVGRGVGRVAGVAASSEPPCRVGVLERVEHAVGVAVEALGVLGTLNALVHREKHRHHGVVHPPVHVDQTEVVEMLVSGESPVEHRGAREAPAPRVRVAEVTPGVKTKSLLHGAVGIGDGGP